jgi:hypothetical protein
MVSATLNKRYYYLLGAGHVSGAGGVSTGLRGMFSAAVGFSPAWSLAAHCPAGMNAWMNAKAGEAVITIIRATTVTNTRMRFISATSFP